jgi:crotonobetainyl-CoA:carnitine CoA-transferase CaiB-like acyl-CoA transferase
MRTDPPYRHFPLHRPRPDGAPLALDGIRVADFTRYLAGPWCTQSLADMGAEVIKIESVVGGDETRSFKPPEIEGESPYFLGLNRGKKSISLNLASAGGVRVARDLARWADIVVENFSPGVMKRLGLDYAALRAVNPELIYCAISAYGSDSSYADQPGFDSVFQAESGFMSLTGEPDRQPMRTGSPVIDIATSMNATSAMLGALVARERGGHGQYVEVAMFDTAISLLGYQPMNYLAGGADPVRQGNEAPVATPIGLFETADGGAVYVSCGTQRSWRTLAEGVLGRPDLIDHPDYADNRLRNSNRPALMSLIAGILRTAPRDHWMERARAAKAPIGAVRSVGEALDAPLARERRIVTRVARPGGADVPNIASPFRFGATPVADPVPAPRLNEHFEEVLRDVLGYDAGAIAELDELGAFSSETRPKGSAG